MHLFNEKNLNEVPCPCNPLVKRETMNLIGVNPLMVFDDLVYIIYLY